MSAGPPTAGAELVLAELGSRGVLTPLDLQLAQTLTALVGETSWDVKLALALVSRAVQHGHVCIEVDVLAEMPLFDAEDEPVEDVTLPPTDLLLQALRQSALTGDGSTMTPLVLQGRSLYLYRYFDYQRRLTAEVRARAGEPAALDEALLAAGLDRLLPASDHEQLAAGQRLAAAVALCRRFAVIAGGPGTGKTTTVVKILALLQEQQIACGEPPLRVLLLAPTGKAAQRLAESLDQQLDGLDCDPLVKAAIPRSASTIHRALGHLERQPTRFRHHRDHPLPVDLVVADEASMIDLALLTKLVEALPRSARLILLGDKDQLASVEAGAILGDICQVGQGFSAPFAARLAQVLGRAPTVREGAGQVADCLVQLSHSHRFGADSSIGALARAVNAGRVEEALEVLRGERHMPYGQVSLAALDDDEPLVGSLGSAVIDGFAPGLDASDPAERLRLASRFRVLCAHRRGRLGVETMNQRIEQHLAAAGALRVEGAFYDGRPIMVTRNDYQLGLFNGDIGVVVEEADGPRAWFPGPGGAPRAFRPGRLPPHETVFAMTVHKSQGSEVDRVAVLLPERDSPILSRELLYTAISRARERVDLFGAEQVLRHALARRIQRASGLSEALRR